MLDDFNDLSSPEGAAYVPVNVHGFARWNTAFAYLDGARTRDNLTVIADALVDRVLLDGRAPAARRCSSTDGRSRSAAELVIVSAGAFGSPGILLRSGIGPGDQLAELGIEVAHDLHGVGANLQDHCGVNIVFGAAPELERELSRQAAAGGWSAAARSSGRRARRARRAPGTSIW